MKSKKWIWVTLTILLTLVVLAGVAGAGFRLGVMQSANLAGNANRTGAQFPSFGHMRGFENNFNNQPGNQPDGGPRMMQGFGQRGFGHGGFGHGRGGFLSPIFSLLKLAVLGVLLWLGFKLVKNSGWRITRVTQPAPVATEVPKGEEKKDAA
jgi:hypothetical protein